MSNLLIKYPGTFYQASYRFGDTIIANKKYHLPLVNGGTVELNNTKIADELYNNLDYNSTTEEPLVLFLDRVSELYMPDANRVLSHSLLHAGSMLGIPKALYSDDNHNLSSISSALSWHLNAGVRSLFMLSPISDKKFHIKLQEHYGLKSETPSNLYNHWQIFTQLAKLANSAWRCNVIYFPRQWIKLVRTEHFAKFAIQLNNILRASYDPIHSMRVQWNNICATIEQKLRLIDYPINALSIAKHIFMIAANSATGFMPALTDDAAPIRLLQEAYADIYGLRQQQYAVTILQAAKFNLYNSAPIYYSTNYSTCVNNNLDDSHNHKKSQITLLEDVRMIHSLYIQHFLANYTKDVGLLYDVIKHTELSYFHTNPESHEHISQAKIIAKQDPRFVTDVNSIFPYNSPFFKGCIKVAAKSTMRQDY